MAQNQLLKTTLAATANTATSNVSSSSACGTVVKLRLSSHTQVERNAIGIQAEESYPRWFDEVQGSMPWTVDFKVAGFIGRFWVVGDLLGGLVTKIKCLSR